MKTFEELHDVFLNIRTFKDLDIALQWIVENPMR